jgi:penicillin-binding protein 1C
VRSRAFLGLAGGAVLCAAFVLAGTAPPPMPDYDLVRASWSPSDVRILDRRGDVLHETRVDASVRRLAWTPLEEVSPSLVRAVIESEDRRFDSHAGVDWRAAAAAAWQALDGGPPRGASTITMQLAALVEPSLRRGAGPRGLTTKLQQMRAAAALERTWTKPRILEAYLNLVGFRGETEGVRAAAETVFGKAPHGLTVEESIALAASIRSPGAPADSLMRRSRELAARLDAGDNARVEAAALRLAGSAAERGSRRAMIPHAARLLLRAPAAGDLSASGGESRRDARLTPSTDARIGPAASGAQDFPRGADVHSSLDSRIQSAANASLRRHVLDIRDRSASDGAVLVVDNASGDVLAYVGSTGELSAAREVDGVRAPRQAGSTLKPFLYALAIDQGLLTPATLLEDTPLEIAVGDTIYRPENYDHRFRGLVPVRTALAASLNIPAVRALTLLGEEKFADTLRELRLGGVKERGEWYGPSLALGSVDVTLWDLVGAYRAMANGGVWMPLHLKPSSAAEAETLRSAASNLPDATLKAPPHGVLTLDVPHRVFDASTAWIVGDMLSDRASRTATFERDGPLSTRYWTAVKTGTSKDMRDNWCVGWSSRYTVGVWIGNFSGAPMHDVSGTSGAAPVWREVMDVLHANAPGESPRRPDGVVEARTVFAGGTEASRKEWYRAGTEPLGSRPAHVAAESEPTNSHSRITVAEAQLDSRPRIVAPASGSVLSLDPDIPGDRQRVPLLASAATGGMTWKLGDRTLGAASAPLLWEPVAGSHELVLTGSDGTRLDSIRFRVNGPRKRM